MRRFSIVILGLILPSITAGAQTAIENPARPSSASAGRVVTLKEELRITDETGEFYLKNPWYLQADEEGSLFLMDINEVLHFDGNGRFLRNYFKPGQGPGEFTRIVRYLRGGEDVLLIGIFPLRLARFDRAGKNLSDFHVQVFGFVEPVAVFGGRAYFFRAGTIPPTGNEARAADVPMNLFSVEEVKGVRDTGLNFPLKRFVYGNGRSGSSADIAELIIAGAGTERIFLSHTEAYSIKAIDLGTGRIDYVFRRDYVRVKVDARNKKYVGRVTLGSFDKSFSRPVPEYFNDIRLLQVVGDRLWAFTSTVDNDKGVLVDVFDFSGRYQDAFFLRFMNAEQPYRLKNGGLAMSNEAMYIREESPAGYISIAKYRLQGLK